MRINYKIKFKIRYPYANVAMKWKRSLAISITVVTFLFSQNNFYRFNSEIK